MEKKKGDPGWNDPPMLNYSASNPPPKTRITNKRVAFPLFGNNPNTTSPQMLSGSMPPTSSGLLPPPLSVPPIGEVAEDSHELFHKVKDNFNKLLLDEYSHINKESIQVLFKLWEKQKLDKDCLNYIFLLSKYLVENNKADAQQMKEKLLNEFQDTCKAWLDIFEL